MGFHSLGFGEVRFAAESVVMVSITWICVWEFIVILIGLFISLALLIFLQSPRWICVVNMICCNGRGKYVRQSLLRGRVVHFSANCLLVVVKLCSSRSSNSWHSCSPLLPNSWVTSCLELDYKRTVPGLKLCSPLGGNFNSHSLAAKKKKKE